MQLPVSYNFQLGHRIDRQADQRGAKGVKGGPDPTITMGKKSPGGRMEGNYPTGKKGAPVNKGLVSVDRDEIYYPPPERAPGSGRRVGFGFF